MHINQLKDSKYLKKEDCGPGILVTIKALTEEDIAMEGAAPDIKWLLHFHEPVKPLILKTTNAQLIAQITKSEETDHWPGHKIVLYNDPTVPMSGKLVGGIRIRAPRNQAPKPAPALAPTPMPHVEREAQAEDDGSNIPF